jgi:hypothetical protein
MLCNLLEAQKQNGEKLLCSGGFGWGYSEKVPTATGNKRKPPTYLDPNSKCIQKTGVRIRGSRGAVQNSKRGRFVLACLKPKRALSEQQKLTLKIEGL